MSGIAIISNLQSDYIRNEVLHFCNSYFVLQLTLADLVDDVPLIEKQ